MTWILRGPAYSVAWRGEVICAWKMCLTFPQAGTSGAESDESDQVMLLA